MLKVEKLFKNYKNGNQTFEVLKGVSFEVKKKEFTAIMGPSGSGKTTLLNCISSFIPNDGGEIWLDGRDIAHLPEAKLAGIRNEQLGFVFQDFMLLDGLTVLENVCIPRILLSQKTGSNGHMQGNKMHDSECIRMEARAEKLLSLFGISDISGKYPAEISGGQRQRTAVARALMNDPLLILADEPTGNLDSKSGEAVIRSFLDARDTLDATVFMVTHDSFSASHCDRVILMQDGNIYKDLYNPGNRRAFLDELLNELKQLGGEN